MSWLVGELAVVVFRVEVDTELWLMFDSVIHVGVILPRTDHIPCVEVKPTLAHACLCETASGHGGLDDFTLV